ncbi:MAG: serine hydrolase [Bacteroidota bacterium]
MRFHIGLFTTLLIVFSGCNHNQKVTESDEVKQYKKFISEMNARGFNTGSILVYKNGKVIFESADGLRRINPNDSLTLDSQFRIASVSKQFTGVAIMKLKQAGKLNYDQKVKTILSDFPYDNITIRHLLHHTSGLGDDEELIDEYFIPQDSTKKVIIGNKVILEVLYRVKPELDFQPGEDWQYSNMGYTVLASIVEKVSKQHFRDFLKEQIFDPLEMNNSSLYKYQEAEDPRMPNRVFGYNKAINQQDLILDDYHLINDVRGSGGVYTTLGDLFKWNMALVNYKILPKAYMDEAWSWGILNNGEKVRYGFGWKFPKDKSKTKTIYHAGGWVGFGTFVYNDIETKSGYVVLTNDSWESFESITDAIDSIRVGAPYILQKKSMGRELLKYLFSDNIDAAISFYQNNKTDTDLYSTNVYEIQNAGYELMHNNYLEEALQIFQLSIKEYPNLPNTYAAYADGLLSKGDTLKALEYYKASLKIDSTFNYSKNRIQVLGNQEGM